MPDGSGPVSRRQGRSRNAAVGQTIDFPLRVYGTVVLSVGGMVAVLLKPGAEKLAYNGDGQGAAWR